MSIHAGISLWWSFLLLSTEEAARWCGHSHCFLFSFLSAVQMHFEPAAIKSYFDKLQHQNKIMRQIRGFKKMGGWGGVTLDRARDTVGKEEILFMLDVVMMLIFRWTIKLGWPHQLPPRWWSGRLVWLLNNDEKKFGGEKKKKKKNTCRICYHIYLLTKRNLSYFNVCTRARATRLYLTFQQLSSSLCLFLPICFAFECALFLCV